MGEVIQIRDYQSKKAHQSLEQQAIEIMTVALMGDPVPLGSEPVIYIDTGPSEMNPYCAPEKDPA